MSAILLITVGWGTRAGGRGRYVDLGLGRLTLSIPPSLLGIYIVDRRFKSPEESMEQLVSYMLDFVQKTRRQRINQRNRTERLSYLLDWKRMGIQYQKMRWLAVRRKYPDAIPEDSLAEEDDVEARRGSKDEDDGLSVSGMDALSESGRMNPVNDDEGVEDPELADLLQATTPKLESIPDIDGGVADQVRGLGIQEAVPAPTAASPTASAAPSAAPSASASPSKPPAGEAGVKRQDTAVGELQKDTVEDTKEMRPEVVAALDEKPVVSKPVEPANKTSPAPVAAAAAPAPVPAKPAPVAAAAAAPASPAKPGVANGHGKASK